MTHPTLEKYKITLIKWITFESNQFSFNSNFLTWCIIYSILIVLQAQRHFTKIKMKIIFLNILGEFFSVNSKPMNWTDRSKEGYIFKFIFINSNIRDFYMLWNQAITFITLYNLSVLFCFMLCNNICIYVIASPYFYLWFWSWIFFSEFKAKPNEGKNR